MVKSGHPSGDHATGRPGRPGLSAPDATGGRAAPADEPPQPTSRPRLATGGRAAHIEEPAESMG